MDDFVLPRAADSDRYHLKPRWHTKCFGNLNDLDWLDAFAFQCHGVKIGVRVSDSDLIPLLQDRLPAAAKPCGGQKFDAIFSVIKGGKVPGSRVRKFHMVYENHSNVGKSHRLDEVLERFESWVALIVAFLAPRHVFVHAGVVSWKGHAIILPGKTLAGKSTLVSELVSAGAKYLSDEFAVLDKNGRVGPWTKPISMRETPTSKQVDVPVVQFGGTVSKRYAPPGLVVLTKYKEGAVWRPRRMTQGAALLGVLDNCVAGRLYPDRVTTALATLTRAVPTLKSPRGEARETARHILATLDRHLSESS